MGMPCLTHRSWRTWEVYWTTAAIWTVKWTIILQLLHLPLVDWCIEFFSITTLPSLPRFLSTRQSVSQSCCMAVRHWPSTEVTSRLLSHCIFAVWRAAVAESTARWVGWHGWNNTCGTFAIEEAIALPWACYLNAGKSTSTSATLWWVSTRGATVM